MKTFIAIALLTVWGFQSKGQSNMEKIIVNDQHAVSVPVGFSHIARESYASVIPKYVREPLWAISYPGEKVLISCTHTEKAVDDNAIPAFTDELITVLRGGSSNFKLADDGIILKDGKNIGYIKYSSGPSSRKKVYNYMFYVSVGDRLVLFNIEYPKKLRKIWDRKAEQVANSIIVHPASAN